MFRFLVRLLLHSHLHQVARQQVSGHEARHPQPAIPDKRLPLAHEPGRSRAWSAEVVVRAGDRGPASPGAGVQRSGAPGTAEGGLQWGRPSCVGWTVAEDHRRGVQVSLPSSN